VGWHKVKILKSLIIAGLAFVSTYVFAEDFSVIVPSYPQTPKLRYAEIQFISNSPTVWVKDLPPDQGRFLRFVLLRDNESLPEFRIESWTYGDEGCCTRLVRARQFDIFSSTLFQSSVSESCKEDLSFGHCVTLTSFTFRALCTSFVAEQVDRKSMMIRKLSTIKPTKK
jgi:hypothetical protein